VHRLMEKVYFSSPVFLQHLAVSAYGHRLRRRRYGANASIYVSELKRTQVLSREQMQELQRNRLRRMVEHAFASVSFYQEWSRESGLEASDIRTVEDIKLLPIVTKDMVRDDPVRFCSTEYMRRREVFGLSTSGTTGKPLTIYCDPDSRTHHYAFFTRLRSWFGIGPQDFRATFFGRIIAKPEQGKPPFWRYDVSQRNVLFSSYHLSRQNLPHYYRKLRELRPTEILGYPSSLARLAAYVQAEGLPPLQPKATIVTAETITEWQRAVIEEGFGSRVVNQYGCTEMVVFAAECEVGRLHINPEHGILEVLDENDQDVKDSVSGRLVCTGLVNRTMPLLRYDLGDVAKCDWHLTCECGRPFPVLQDIEGRCDDVLLTPDGRPLGRMDPVFKGLRGIRETQIEQTDRHKLVFHMVLDESFTGSSRAELMREIRKRVGPSMEIEIRRVGEIPREPNGKFRSVVSRLAR
jgi:phenylacetate-CoA ligase